MRKYHVLLLCLGIAATAIEVRAQQTRLTPELRQVLAEDMEWSLQEELFGVWYPLAVDSVYGGFLSQFDYQFRPTEQQDKMIVTQSRHVWTTAKASQFFPEEAGYLSQAAHGFVFLRDKMWDKEQGGFYWLVARDGTVKPERDGRIIKQAYGEAFGIYALAAYFEASGDEAALRLAQEAFRWLDAHAHDPVHKGYFNYMERDGTPLREGYAGTPPKDQNSSIHLLEAFTELYKVWPDSVLRERLNEMLVLIRDTITVEPGYLTLFSTAEWRPVSYRDSSDAARKAHVFLDHVSFGHDVETAYLMIEASEALGLEHDARTLAAGKKMVDHALRTGWDGALGGFYDAGYYFRESPRLVVLQDTKNWWTQAEGLNTLLLMADAFPDDSMRYEEQILKLWSYIDTYLIDHRYGGWYEAGLDKEPERRTVLKGHIWKAAYHDSRALMNVVRRLRGEVDK